MTIETEIDEDEIAICVAINLLRDSIESGRMPSGLALTQDVRAVHERAIDHLEAMLRRLADAPQA